MHETMSVFRGLSPENLVEQMSRDGHWTPEKSEKYSMGPPRTFEVWVKDGRCGGMWEEHWPEKFRSRSGWEVCHVSAREGRGRESVQRELIVVGNGS